MFANKGNVEMTRNAFELNDKASFVVSAQCEKELQVLPLERGLDFTV
jgi:hypothetical protein